MRLFAALLFAPIAAPIPAQVTQRINVDSGGGQAAGGQFGVTQSISSDNRCIAFACDAVDLVQGDTNLAYDVFVRDRVAGTTELISRATNGLQGDDDSGGPSSAPSISGDGRYVAFPSAASNLVPGDTNGQSDVFVRDRIAGTTERVSVASGGTEGNSTSGTWAVSITADGRYVAFDSLSSNLVGADTNNIQDVFVHDRQGGTTERVSVATGGAQANDTCFKSAISADGRRVAFFSYASNLVGGDTNGHGDVFVHDRASGTTERVSVDSNGSEGDASADLGGISADGRFVVFTSASSNLVPGDTNGSSDSFVRDRRAGTTERVTVDSSGAQGNGHSAYASISADGRTVAFASFASNLVPGDTNGLRDVFVRDRTAGTTVRASVSTAGSQASGGQSLRTSISADGRFVLFTSDATNLVPGDTNGVWDGFLRDRDATGFTSVCEPGLVGVLACPCSNPPSGAGRGCDNSSGTGGARLAASGIAYLATDSLIFTTSDETATATSLLLQGTTASSGGIVYGQGLRCVAGSLVRLFTKSAVGGSITAPDFFAGDPSVSARSASKGDVIHAGQSRWYLVFYRDPTVLGGCPASSTFNATQTGRIDWSL